MSTTFALHVGATLDGARIVSVRYQHCARSGAPVRTYARVTLSDGRTVVREVTA